MLLPPVSLSFHETTLLFHSDPSSCCLALCSFVIDTGGAVFAHVGVIIILIVLLLVVVFLVVVVCSSPFVVDEKLAPCAQPVQAQNISCYTMHNTQIV